MQEVYSKLLSNCKWLIRLRKKFTKSDWSKECQVAFDFLKDSLTAMPVLAYPDTSKPYILYIDGSDDCIGACLCQEQDTQVEMKSNEPNGKSFHYLLHECTASKTNWPSIEKGAFAILYALQKSDQYLHDSGFVIKRGHKPQVNHGFPVQNKKIQHWTTNICGYMKM